MDDNKINETLSIEQRRKRAQIMRAHHTKIERARELAQRKLAAEKNIRKRAFQMARSIMRKKLAGERGAEYAQLGPSEKIAIDRMLDNKAKAIKKLALRLMPKVKKAEYERLQSYLHGHSIQNMGAEEGHTMKEDINELFEAAFTFPQDPNRPNLSGSPNSTMNSGLGKPRVASNGGKSKNSNIEFYNGESKSKKIAEALDRKADQSGIDFDVLAEVFSRGLEAWNKNSKVTQEQYAFARVNSYINQGKTYFNEDADLHELGPATLDSYAKKSNKEAKGLVKQIGDINHKKYAGRSNYQPLNKLSSDDEAQKSKLLGKLKNRKIGQARAINNLDRMNTEEVNLDESNPAQINEASNAVNISKAEYDKLKKKHETTPAGRNFSNATHVYKKDDEVWRQTYSHPSHGIPTIQASHEKEFPYKQKKWQKFVKEDTSIEEEKKGLWANIHAKRRSGKRMRRPGEKGRPTAADFRSAQTEQVENNIQEELLNEAQKFGKHIGTVNGYHIHDLGANTPYKDKRYLAYANHYGWISHSAPTKSEINKKSKELTKSETPKSKSKEEQEHDDWRADQKQRIASGEVRRAVMSRRGIRYEQVEPQAQHANTKKRKSIENVDRDTNDKTELGKQTEIIRKIIEQTGNKVNDPKKRLQGTDSLVKAYKGDTPGEGLNESFNIAFAAGVGVTLTAADLGMRAQGGFAHHPSVIDQIEENAVTADKQPVVIPAHKDAYGNNIPAKTVMRRTRRKILDTGNTHDGEPN